MFDLCSLSTAGNYCNLHSTPLTRGGVCSLARSVVTHPLRAQNSAFTPCVSTVFRKRVSWLLLCERNNPKLCLIFLDRWKSRLDLWHCLLKNFRSLLVNIPHACFNATSRLQAMWRREFSRAKRIGCFNETFGGIVSEHNLNRKGFVSNPNSLAITK